MMSGRPRQFKEATLNSAIKVLKAAGCAIGGIEVRPDGTVRVLTSEVASSLSAEEPNPFDEPEHGRHRA